MPYVPTRRWTVGRNGGLLYIDRAGFRIGIYGHHEFNIIRGKALNGNAFTIGFCLQAEVGDGMAKKG